MSRFLAGKSASNPKRSANLSLETELDMYRRDALSGLTHITTDCIGWWLCTEPPTPEERAFWAEKKGELDKVIHTIENHLVYQKKRFQPENQSA
jgi:hypothetical protein